jgi:hypothetical protein
VAGDVTNKVISYLKYIYSGITRVLKSLTLLQGCDM